MNTSPPVILITGASSGIGNATALRFAQAGYRVVLAARRGERLQALAEQIRTAGGQALPVPTDMAQLEALKGLVSQTLNTWGQVDVLFNNAGFGRINWLEKLDPVEDIQAQFQVNLIGLVQLTHLVLPGMIARRTGHIINMSSLAGWVGVPTYTIYAASKYAVRGFSEALRREVGMHGIRVSTIYPGGTRTDFATRARLRTNTRRTTPSFLRLEPDAVAQAVLRLASHPRRDVVLPGSMNLVLWLNGIFPGLVDWVITWRYTRSERAADEDQDGAN